MIDLEYANAQNRVKAAREELQRAEQDTKRYNKTKRDEERKSERRAAIVGQVAMSLGATDGDFWDAIWPHLMTLLADASTEDRALFQLPPRATAEADRPHDNIGVSTSSN